MAVLLCARTGSALAFARPGLSAFDHLLPFADGRIHARMPFVRGRVSLDRSGRIVLPKVVRDKLQLAPGDTFDLVLQGDDLTLRPTRTSTPLYKERGVWVFRTGEPLTAAETDETLRQIRTRVDRHNSDGGS